MRRRSLLYYSFIAWLFSLFSLQIPFPLCRRGGGGAVRPPPPLWFFCPLLKNLQTTHTWKYQYNIALIQKFTNPSQNNFIKSIFFWTPTPGSPIKQFEVFFKISDIWSVGYQNREKKGVMEYFEEIKNNVIIFKTFYL